MDKLVDEINLPKNLMNNIFSAAIEAVDEAFKSKNFSMNGIIKSALKKTIIKEVKAGNVQLPGSTDNPKKLTDGNS